MQLEEIEVSNAEKARQERREAFQALMEIIRQIHAVQPPMTQEEIDEEISAYRAEQRKASEDKS